MDEKNLYDEEAFLLYLLQFAIDEWGPQNVSLQHPSSFNSLSIPRDIRCDPSTESVVTLTIDCGTHRMRYHTLAVCDVSGFFTCDADGAIYQCEGSGVLEE